MRAAKRIPKGSPNYVNSCLWLVEVPLAYIRRKFLGLVIYFVINKPWKVLGHPPDSLIDKALAPFSI